MNSAEISNIVKRDPVLNNIFMGIFASDTLPQYVLYKPAALIVNTDTSDKSGEHWIGIYFDRNGTADYFDSYGLEPFVPSLVQFMKQNSARQIFTNKHIQSIDASVCGMYCIYFLYQRSREVPVHKILDKFDSNFTRNDVIVCNFVYRAFGEKHSVCCSNVKMQTCVPYCKFRKHYSYK